MTNVDGVRVPEVGDPIVIDGTKYRIRSFGGAPRFNVYVKTSFGRVERAIPRASIGEWDTTAGVWRVRL